MTNKLIASLTVAATMLALASSAADTARERKLQQAIDLMESKGDLAKAIPMLEDVARSSDRALAARALLHLGDAQQRRGGSQARATYERIVKEFASESETASAARQRLASLGAAGLFFGKRRVCTDCGNTSDLLSADGHWLVFTDWNNGDLAIRDMSNGQVKRLLAKPGTYKNDPAEAENSVLSPDLRQVAFSWDGLGKEDRHQVRLMPNEPGAKVRVLVDSPGDTWYDVNDWSPDGKSILVVILHKQDQTRQIARISTSDGSIKVLKELGWRRYNIGTRISFSSDGQWIVYQALAVSPTKNPPDPSDRTDTHIYVLSADGSRETEIVKAAGVNRHPVWTPDGTHILFISNRTGQWDLWSVAFKDGKAAGSETLVQAQIGDIHPMGFRGASYYYYAESTTSGEYVNIVDLGANRNSPGRVARATESFVGVRPTWSPDGKSIAFKRHHSVGPDGFDLVVRSLETGDERAYLSKLGTSGGLGGSEWFRDGKTIASAIAGKAYRVDLKTGEFTPLPFPSAPGQLSPDGKTAYLMEQDSSMTKPDRVLAIDLSTGQKQELFTMPEPGQTWFWLTSDGRTVIGRRIDRNKVIHLFRVQVDGTGYRELYIIEWQDFHDNFTLTKDGRWIVLAKRTPESNWQLLRIPIEGGAPQDMGVDLDGALMGRSMDMSPDGSRIAFTTSKNAGELWALDNVLAEIK